MILRIAMLLCFTLKVFADLNPVEMPQVIVKGNYVLLPTAKEISGLKRSQKLDFLSGVAISFQMPIIKYFHSGINLTLNATSYLPPNAIKKSGNGLIEFGTFFKPQLPITLPSGHLNLYAYFPIGFSIVMGTMPLTGQTIKLSGPPSDNTPVSYSYAGAGLNTGAYAGLSYYFIPEVGLFFEGGYKYGLLSHNSLNNRLETVKFFAYNYAYQGVDFMFGLNIVT